MAARRVQLWEPAPLLRSLQQRAHPVCVPLLFRPKRAVPTVPGVPSVPAASLPPRPMDQPLV